MPSAGTPTFVVTGNYYAGPGYISRVCVRLGLGTTHCSTAVKLGHEGCVADLASSTTVKKASSDALGEFVNTDSGTACTGWLEESTNNGKTRHAVSAFHTILTRKTASLCRQAPLPPSAPSATSAPHHRPHQHHAA